MLIEFEDTFNPGLYRQLPLTEVPVLYDHIRLVFHFKHLEKIEVTIKVKSILYEAAILSQIVVSGRSFCECVRLLKKKTTQPNKKNSQKEMRRRLFHISLNSIVFSRVYGCIRFIKNQEKCDSLITYLSKAWWAI